MCTNVVWLLNLYKTSNEENFCVAGRSVTLGHTFKGCPLTCTPMNVTRAVLHSYPESVLTAQSYHFIVLGRKPDFQFAEDLRRHSEVREGCVHTFWMQLEPSQRFLQHPAWYQCQGCLEGVQGCEQGGRTTVTALPRWRQHFHHWKSAILGPEPPAATQRFLCVLRSWRDMNVWNLC